MRRPDWVGRGLHGSSYQAEFRTQELLLLGKARCEALRCGRFEEADAVAKLLEQALREHELEDMEYDVARDDIEVWICDPNAGVMTYQEWRDGGSNEPEPIRGNRW